MIAAICRSYGPPELAVSIEECHPPPRLSAGQLRVRVSAAAVNYPDVLMLANTYQLSVPVPFVPGSEFAGLVAESTTDAYRPGDRVMGTTMVGAFASEVVVSASSVTRVPDGVSDQAAAAFGIAHRTAYHVLRSIAEVQPGEELVVLGAGGGVGLAAVQLGSLLGAATTAVASSPAKLAAAKSHGPARQISSQPVNFRDALRAVLPDGADVVLDPVGGDLAEPALRSLRWGGRFVTVGYASGVIPCIPLNLVLLKGCHVLGCQVNHFAEHAPDKHRRDEQELLGLLAAGRAFPHISATYPLAEAAAALRHVADRNAIGKVVLHIA